MVLEQAAVRWVVVDEADAAAGEIVVEKGVLNLVSDRSGHYQPDTVFSNPFLNALRSKGVDLTNVVL